MSIENEVDRRVSVALQGMFTLLSVFLNPVFDKQFLAKIKTAAILIREKDYKQYDIEGGGSVSVSKEGGRIEIGCRLISETGYENYYEASFYSDTEFASLINAVYALRQLHGKADGG